MINENIIYVNVNYKIKSDTINWDKNGVNENNVMDYFQETVYDSKINSVYTNINKYNQGDYIIETDFNIKKEKNVYLVYIIFDTKDEFSSIKNNICVENVFQTENKAKEYIDENQLHIKYDNYPKFKICIDKFKINKE